MNNSFMKLIACSLCSIVFLSGCQKNNVPFQFTNKDAEDVAKYTGVLSNIDNQTVFELSVSDRLLNNNLAKKNVIAFKYDEALSLSNSASRTYISYEDIVKTKVTFKNIETNDEKNGFKIFMGTNNSDRPAFFINKTNVLSGNFILCKPYQDLPQNNSVNDQQNEYEKTYLENSEEFNTSSDGKFLIGLFGNIISLTIGIATENPLGAFNAALNLTNVLFDKACPGTTTGDIMNKLNQMDKKLDIITNILNESFNELKIGIKAVEAAVDKVLLEQYTDRVNSFLQNESREIDDFKRNMKIDIDKYLKEFVQAKRDLNFYVAIKNGETLDYVASPQVDKEKDQRIVFSISDFSYSKDYLKKHNNIISKDFDNELLKDIESSLNNIFLPAGIKTTHHELANIVLAHLYEQFTKQYFLDNDGLGKDIFNSAIAFCKVISGRMGSSVVESFINKIKYAFNFGVELKEHSRGFLANLMHQLDAVAYLVTISGFALQINTEEFKEEYVLARNVIQNAYKSIKALSDHYCFTTNTLIDGYLMHAYFDCGFNNYSSKNDFYHNVVVDRVYGGFSWQNNKININRYNLLNEDEYTPIIARYNMLISNKYIETSSKFYEYLSHNEILDYEAKETFEYLKEAHRNDASTPLFMTNLKQREATLANDKGSPLYFVQGNPEYDDFKRETVYGYGTKLESDCWSGGALEANLLSGDDGRSLGQKKIAMYAMYYQKHAFTYSQFAAFLDNGTSFFALYHF